MRDLNFYRRLIVLNGFIPLLMLAWDAWNDQVGANAVNRALHITGNLSLVFLFLSLVITPLRKLTGWNSLIAFRRALGLFGFMYAVVHLGIYVGLDRALSLSSTLSELLSRRYLQVGGIAVLLMVPLAMTSTNAMIQRIGPRRWKQLHRLSYLVAILGVAHYYLLVKSDIRQPVAFAAVLTPLLGYRILHEFRNRRPKTAVMPGMKRSSTSQTKRNFWQGQLQVVKIFPETHNVKTFRFQLPAGGPLPFQYRAGQYLNIRLPIDGHVVRRSYTISSAPMGQVYCEISVKREEQGVVSRYLHDAVREGMTFEISAPAGRFVFEDTQHAAVTLIAGGVGITPMMSMARCLTERPWTGEIYFILVTRTANDIIFHAELQRMAARYSNFHLHITLTDGKSGDNWPGAVGRLTERTLTAMVPSIDSQPAFVCGPGPMMDATREILRTLGVPTQWIITEAFVSPATANEPAAPMESELNANHAGLNDAEFESIVSFSKSQVVITATSHTTVLEAAEAAGVDLAWECRSGICGQCKVHCPEGSVHMASHDALTAKEKGQGYILACQAHPRSAQLRIDA